MPKPILSDSLFNADDVATAILSEANLQVANSNLGVTDKSSIFSGASGVSMYDKRAYSFNGFMFVSWEFKHENSVPSNAETLATITDSNFYPVENTRFGTIGYEGDNSAYVKFETDGNIKVYSASGSGVASWYGVINGFYRYA